MITWIMAGVALALAVPALIVLGAAVYGLLSCMSYVRGPWRGDNGHE